MTVQDRQGLKIMRCLTAILLFDLAGKAVDIIDEAIAETEKHFGCS
jgi:hypothetical protein